MRDTSAREIRDGARSRPGRGAHATHGYIDFTLDLHRLPADAWVLLGEATSKAQHVGRSLLSPEVAGELLQVYVTKGALATTAIEGNTLSETEARAVIEETLRLPPSKEYLGQEIRNVVETCNEIKDDLLANPGMHLTPTRIKRYNESILKGLKVEDHVAPGEYRDVTVVVGAYRAPAARDVDALVTEMCNWLNGPAFIAPADRVELRAPLAIVKAIVAHLYLVWIHPFGDGNGRTARLVELQILLQSGFPMPTCQLLSNHYNVTRSAYYRELHRAGETGQPYDFITYAVEGFRDGLKDQLDAIWAQEVHDRWQSFVYEQCGEARSDADRRRIKLVLALSDQPQPTPRAGLRRLSTELAELYAGKTDKTLTRDLNAIRELGLIRSTASGWEATREQIFAYLPLQRVGVLDPPELAVPPA